MSFPRIKSGFDAAEKLYGFSLTNANLMAAIAAKMGYQDIAHAQFERIGDSWSSEAFGNKDYFQTTRTWAMYMGAPPLSASKNEGEANMQTPEGRRYEAEFRRKYANVIRTCFQLSDSTLGNSELYIAISKDGRMERMVADGKNPAAACLYQLFNKTLSPPSHAPLWIKLTFASKQPHEKN
jgi:hypothetical protein